MASGSIRKVLRVGETYVDTMTMRGAVAHEIAELQKGYQWIPQQETDSDIFDYDRQRNLSIERNHTWLREGFG